MKILLLAFCLNIIMVSAAVAQTADSTRCASQNLWWVDAGLGVHKGLSTDDLVSLSGNLNYLYNNWLYKLRYGFYDDFNIMGSQTTDFNEIGFMIGKARIKKLTRLSASAGAGIVFGKKNERKIEYKNGSVINISSEMHTFFSPAFLIEGEAAFTPIKQIGIGLFINGNFNANVSNLGFGLRLSAGRMRE